MEGLQQFERAGKRQRFFSPDPVQSEALRQQLEAILGPLSDDDFALLEHPASKDLQKAVNDFLDGTIQRPTTHQDTNNIPTETTGSSIEESQLEQPEDQESESQLATPATGLETSPLGQDSDADDNWKRRYLGSFQATIWSTRAGRDLIKFDEKLHIYRPGKRNTQGVSDYIVRLKGESGTDVARMSEVDAKFMAVLIDTATCYFEGTCIYAPPHLFTGDSIIIQVDCFINKSAFLREFADLSSATIPDAKPIFVDESKEAASERVLRQRQVGLVQLLAKVGMSENELPDMVQAIDSVNASGQDGDDTVNDNQMDMIYQQAIDKQDLEEVEPAKSLAFSLFSYQKKSLGWMLDRESGEVNENMKQLHPLWTEFTWPREQTPFYANLNSGELSIDMPIVQSSKVGGILADEMGLGKTISTLSMIHTAAATYQKENMVTLIVVPMSLLTQWESEISAASVPDSIRVHVHYGAQSESLSAFVAAGKSGGVPRIVLTTYGVISSEHKQLLKFREVNGKTVTNSAWQNSRGLLGLFGIDFYRVVLDEAHNIKNRNTQMAKSCFALRAEKRWALTGTPIVNRLEDVYSLIKFLGVEPWNNFSFWKAFITTPFESKNGAEAALNTVQTIISPICLRRTKDMQQDGKPLVDLPEKVVEIKRIAFTPDEKALYSLVYSRVRSSVKDQLDDGSATKHYASLMTLLMRLRQVCCHARLLPFHKEGNSSIKADEVDPEDNMSQGAPQTVGLDQDSDVASLLDSFYESEQHSRELDSYGREILRKLDKDMNDSECPICSAEPIPANELALTQCLHMACFDCLLTHIDFHKSKGTEPTCPICRSPISSDRLYLVDNSGGKITVRRNRTGQQSAKTKALVQELRNNPSNGKNVVFSQFTSFLNIIEEELSFHSIKTVRFDGSMSMKQRAVALEEFSTSKTDIVLLVSLKAGGVGLNLVCAQQAFLMDPWWSYAIEAQAIDRIHRMGQTANVRIVRFIIEGTIEERILRIQERKKALSGVLTAEERRTEQIENIRTLFGLEDEL